ncbi:MAG: hypothetical protein LQ337_006810 [Flavoplaca oasis]|nr:MAG: hypothetical protein LQ337_006810 [Flavoplaca oasis]
MVATRSQDQEPVQASKASKTTERNREKRKRIDDIGPNPTPKPQIKKPKTEGASRGSRQTTSSTLAAVVIPTTKNYEINGSNIAIQDESIGNDGAPARPPPHRAEQGRLHLSNSDNQVTVPSTMDLGNSSKDTTSQRSEIQTEVTRIKKAESTPSMSSNRKKAQQSHRTEPASEKMSSAALSVLDEAQNSRHKRFESEEAFPELLPSHSTNPSPRIIDEQRTAQDDALSASDEEAPEVVTKASGQQQARSVAAEATKAAKMQRAAEKQRRRDRDSRLKLQAKISKVEAAKPKMKEEQADTSSEEDEDHPQNAVQDTWTRQDASPALLPDEILAAEPAPRMPTPPLRRDVMKATVNTRHRFLDQASKPPKDIQTGNVRIRVLEDRRAILPPKVSKNSQMLRESWLAGRRGPKGNVLMKRRKMGTGFIRK